MKLWIGVHGGGAAHRQDHQEDVKSKLRTKRWVETSQVERDVLNRGHFYFKGPDNKYFSLSKPYSLNYSSLTLLLQEVSSYRKYMSIKRNECDYVPITFICEHRNFTSK